MPTPATLTHATRRKAVVADLLLFSVAVFWGSNFVFIKDVVARTTELAAGSIVAGTMLYLVLRYVVATGIFAVAQPRSWLGSSRGDWARGGLLGVFYLTALILQTIGLQRTSPGVSGFITGRSVAMVPFLYWFVARRSPGRWQIVGAVVATIGLGALSLQGDFSIRWGDAITLQAVADRYGVRVCILSSYPTRCFLEVVPRGGRHASRRVLWLSFLAEQHYNSLYPSHAPPPPLPHDKLLGSRRLYALVRGGAPEDAAATALRAAG